MFEPKIKKMNWFIRTITFNRIAGITLAPFGVYLKEQYLTDQTTIRHESIHWKQQLEMLIVFFYVWYLVEWIIRMFTNFGRAYESISFEREAYANEYDLDYLKRRKHFAWVGYFRKKV